MPNYRVLVGISYGSPEKHVEPGNVVSDLSARDVEWMLADGVIEAVEPPRRGARGDTNVS